MKQSKYDTDHDGVCDAPECKDILTITDREDPYPEQTAILKDNSWSRSALTLDDKQLERGTMYNKCNDANSHHDVLRRAGLGQGLRRRRTRSASPLFNSAASGRAAVTTRSWAQRPTS